MVWTATRWTVAFEDGDVIQHIEESRRTCVCAKLLLAQKVIACRRGCKCVVRRHNKMLRYRREFGVC